MIVLVGGTTGILTGGQLSDCGLRVGRRDAALGVATVSSVAGFVASAALLPARGSATASVVILFVGVFLLAMPAGSCYAAAQMVLPIQVCGQAMALILLIANFGGLTLGPLLPGVLNDYVFESAAALGLSLGATPALTTLSAAIVFNAARPAYGRHHLALNP